MLFEYTFTREEYLKANAKYMRKFTAFQLIMGIIFACLLVAMFVTVIVRKYAYGNTLDELEYTKGKAAVYFLTLFCALLFSLVFGMRYSSKKAHENFFNTYNEDGLLRYRVELTDTEVVVSYKQNVAHLSLNGITRVVEVGGCLFTLFNINSVLIVKVAEDTKPLVDKLKNCVPVKKKKKG